MLTETLPAPQLWVVKFKTGTGAKAEVVVLAAHKGLAFYHVWQSNPDMDYKGLTIQLWQQKL